MSEYVVSCVERARQSIRTLREQGARPKKIELSNDVIIEMWRSGGLVDRLMFMGLPIIERGDLKNHIQAVP